MKTSPLLTPSNLADFGPVGPKFLRTLNTKKCSPFRALVVPVKQNGINNTIYESRASRTVEVWTRPDKSKFYVRNRDGQIFTLYRTEAALNNDDDNPDIIGLTQLTWHLLEYIEVDKLSNEIFQPELPEACFEDVDFDDDDYDDEAIQWDDDNREWLAHSMFNIKS